MRLVILYQPESQLNIIFSEGFSKIGITASAASRVTYMAEYRNNSHKYTGNVLHTKTELTTLCTMIIFASSVKHTALNFLQWEYGSFAPVSPYCMRGDLPTENDRGNITQKFVMDSLPGPQLCITAAGIAFTLTEFSEDEVFLLLQSAQSLNKKKCRKSSIENLRIHGRKLINKVNAPPVVRVKEIDDSAFQTPQSSSLSSNLFPPRWQFSMPLGARGKAIDDSVFETLHTCSLGSELFPPRWLFNEEEVKIAFLTFQHRLHKIEEQIEERNSRLAVPYTVLLPSRIPSGIAI